MNSKLLTWPCDHALPVLYHLFKSHWYSLLWPLHFIILSFSISHLTIIIFTSSISRPSLISCIPLVPFLSCTVFFYFSTHPSFPPAPDRLRALCSWTRPRSSWVQRRPALHPFHTLPRLPPHITPLLCWPSQDQATVWRGCVSFPSKKEEVVRF